MKKAIAIKYSKKLPAPFIIAKGRNMMAEKLISIAEDNNITILHEEELLNRLFMIEIGDFIPEDVYEVVAEILAYVYTTQMNVEMV